MTDKPLTQPAKALQGEEQLDHQNAEPAGQGGDGLQQLRAQDGWFTRYCLCKSYKFILWKSNSPDRPATQLKMQDGC